MPRFRVAQCEVQLLQNRRCSRDHLGEIPRIHQLACKACCFNTDFCCMWEHSCLLKQTVKSQSRGGPATNTCGELSRPVPCGFLPGFTAVHDLRSAPGKQCLCVGTLALSQPGLSGSCGTGSSPYDQVLGPCGPALLITVNGLLLLNLPLGRARGAVIPAIALIESTRSWADLGFWRLRLTKIEALVLHSSSNHSITASVDWELWTVRSN